jgi:hypothetical protein
MPIYFMKKFPVRCIVYAKRGNEVVKLIDQGRRFSNDRGEVYFRLKRAKRNTVPVAWDYVYNAAIPTKKGKSVNVVYFYSPSPSLFFPIELTEDLELALKAGNMVDVESELPDSIKKLIKIIEDPEKVKIPVNEKIEQWLDWEGFRIYKNNVLTESKSSMEKYFPHIVLVIIIIVTGVFLFIVSKPIMDAEAMSANSVKVWNDFNTRYMDISEKLITLVQEGKIPVEVVKAPPPAV